MEYHSAESVIIVEIDVDGEKKDVQHSVESVVCMHIEEEGQNKQVKFLMRFKDENGSSYCAMVKEALARWKFPSFVKKFEEDHKVLLFAREELIQVNLIFLFFLFLFF